MSKRQISVNLDEEIVNWLDEKIKERKFASRSHGLEFAVDQLMKEEMRLKERGNV